MENMTSAFQQKGACVCQWKQTLKRCNQTSSQHSEVPFPPWRHPRKSMIASRQILRRFPEIKAFRLIIRASVLISLSHSLLTFWAGVAVTAWGLQEEAGSCLPQVWDTWTVVQDKPNDMVSLFLSWWEQWGNLPRAWKCHLTSAQPLCDCFSRCQELTAGG